ncbi:ABC-three component system middle component 2 [Dactylosporangium sp. McL0621]|uniref:ABC-three component system middle component 2 n=1 Tax=Dactylosporangium sp. McL0621 TaxID=3415678 RepID=UPI003CF2961B
MIAAPLNSPLEVGLRVAFLLSFAYPRSFDLATLAQLDHALLHTGQSDGPPSIHPELPGSIGELAIKEDLVRAGLDAMIRAGLVFGRPTGAGFKFAATENARPFISVLGSPYAVRLRNRAEWVVERLPDEEQSEPSLGLRAMVRKWIAEGSRPEEGGADA